MQHVAEVRQILLKAKAALAAGWIQGDLMNEEEEAVCLYGALVRGANMQPLPPWACGTSPSVEGRGGDGSVTFGIFDGSPEAEAVVLLAELAGVTDSNKLALWNDEPDRTAEQVVDLFDRALEALPAPEPYRCGIAAIDNRADLSEIGPQIRVRRDRLRRIGIVVDRELVEVG
jgi:hypothetical protein